MGIRSSYNRATYFAKAAESRPGWVKSGEPYPNQYDVWYGDKAIISGGNDPTQTNVIQYTMISGGVSTNSVDFGDLTAATTDISGCANATRGCFGGGLTPTRVNTITYVTIGTLGNSTDFGDLVQPSDHNTACSNMNGGLL